jgi:DNA-binding NarL/FixJ family response regulator
VGCASSGAEALRVTEKLEPEVALVDVQLGSENGLQLARRLAVCAPTMAVILISSHSQDEIAELIVESPALGFLPKSALGSDAIAELLGYRASR